MVAEQITEEALYPGVDPRVRVFRHGEIVDTFAVVTDRYLVLVDTGTRPEGMETVMGLLAPAAADLVLLVLNTHGDWDHVWGNCLFAGPDARYPAPIIAHSLAADRMRGLEAEKQLASFQAQYPDLYGSVRWCLPTVLVQGELRIDGGDLSLHLLHTPGHTPDHFAVWIPELRLLLPGDAAEMPFPLISEEGSVPQLRDSLRRMAALQPDILLACHAPGSTSPDLLEDNLAYFEDLERRCREARADVGGSEDPAGALGWPIEEALPAGNSIGEIADLDFYRRFHDRNIRAMCAHVARGN